jgi:hypothetical protein
MSSAFSGILSYGFMHLNTHGSGDSLGQRYGPTKANPTAPTGQLPGIAGWRWIFIMQGVLTCAIALVGFVTIIDFPEHAAKKWCGFSFLTQQESEFVVARIEKDRKDAIAEPFQLGKYLRGALDLKVWGFAAIFGLTTTITYAIAFFLPIILRDGMGFSIAMSQCLVAPPYVAAAIVMFGMAWAGDRYHIRSPFIIANGIMALIGMSPSQVCCSIANSLRLATPRLHLQRWPSLLRRVPRHHRRQREHSLRSDLASQQHPRPVEACSLLRNPRRHRWHWRHRWQHRFP